MKKNKFERFMYDFLIIIVRKINETQEVNFTLYMHQLIKVFHHTILTSLYSDSV